MGRWVDGSMDRWYLLLHVIAQSSTVLKDIHQRTLRQLVAVDRLAKLT
jgi:hypothetical protein